MKSNITATVQPGDEGRPYATVTVNGYEVIVYESLREPGRLVIDVDTTGAQPEDECGERVAIAVNDGYVHGGPAQARPVVAGLAFVSREEDERHIRKYDGN